MVIFFVQKHVIFFNPANQPKSAEIIKLHSSEKHQHFLFTLYDLAPSVNKLISNLIYVFIDFNSTQLFYATHKEWAPAHSVPLMVI